MADPTIKIIPNGPYRVTGPIAVTDPQGNVVTIEEGKGVSFCRCGASAKKPYCDGSHARVGFDSTESAVKS
ncbi:MAG TPA: CDGSH iron-sulfur domain-containing protein [Thermoanaerobaculia bacterium]|jgi:CDGSH-type Zn-finger protein|nr:CDGSH iron-sulfur domain-containing protein [Thermoanaerobaculia bacterium]